MTKPLRALERLRAASARVSLFFKASKSRQILAAIVLTAFLLGMICLIVIPPWWHYDEPGHFEYVWLAAHSPTWPVVGQYDQSMRKEMAVSLLQYGWYQIRNIEPNFESSEPLPIGVTQVGDQPGYYFLASLPLRLMPNAGFIVQYYAARFVSLVLFLLIVVIVWYALGEIMPEDHPLRWMTTFFVAVLPAFADTMVSVNNDVSAVLAASLFLWASLRLIQKGYSIGRILFLFSSLVVCYLSKSTAWFAFPLTPFVLILASLRGRFTVFVWGATAIGLIALAVLTLKWGGPRDWYQGAAGDVSVRTQSTDAPLGRYAFEFNGTGTNDGSQILQIMPSNQWKALRGKTVTLGAWIWADQPIQAEPMFIRVLTHGGDTIYSSQTPIDVTTRPTFYKVAFDFPGDATYAFVYAGQAAQGPLHGNVFFDGLVLVPGEFSSSPPRFSDANGAQVEWDGQKFNNLIRNGSAEQGGFQLRKWVDDRTNDVLTKSGISLPLIITTVQDWKGTAWYYQGVASTLFRTFWASLAGDKAFLRSSYVNDFLQVLTVIGMAGAGIRLWMRRRTVHWDLIGLLGMALLLPWILAVTKGTSSFLQGYALFPWARYAYPAILPTGLLLCAGWLEWLELLPANIRPSSPVRGAIFLAIMLGITVFAVLNAIQVLRQPWWYGWVSLALLFLFQYVIFYFSTKWWTRLSS